LKSKYDTQLLIQITVKKKIFMAHEMDSPMTNDEQLDRGVEALNIALLNLANRDEEYYIAEEDEREFDIEMEYGEVKTNRPEQHNELLQRTDTSEGVVDKLMWDKEKSDE
jgi:hypothetical protein